MSFHIKIECTGDDNAIEFGPKEQTSTVNENDINLVNIKFDTIDEQHEYNERYRAVYDEYYATLYTGGYQIYTSIEPKKQRLLQKTIDETLSVDEEKNEDYYGY